MAQHQDLKRKGGAPDHQAAIENAQPPPLSIEVPKIRDLPNKSKPWSDVQLPVDILLLTVEDCEFLACYTYLTNAVKSYHVYFGTTGESGEESLKVALMRCSKGSSGPSGSLVTVKNAVVQLGPKAVFSIGCCIGLNQKGTKLGDVVVSSTLTTDEFTAPVRRNIANLIRFSTEGWNPPLKDTAAGEQVQVHRDSSILSGVNEPAIPKQCRKSESHMIASEREEEDLSMKKQPASQPKKKLPDSVCLEKCQKRLKMIYNAKSKVRIIPWDQSSAVDIDEMYTQLTWLKDHRKPSGVTQNKLESYTEIFNGGKRLLVYGRPGIGKTVFTKKAAFDWSQQRYQETIGAFELVLLIRLRDVCNLHDVPSIFKASQLLANDGKISVDDLYGYVLNHQEKVLLILDGYDEYSATHQSPVDEIWKRNQLSDCCVIITSRQMTTDKLREPSDAQFEINGFDDKRQKKFARRFLKDEDDVRNFRIYLREQHLKDLAEIPLLLLILCLLWKEKDRKELPKKRVEIFNQFVKTLFHHMHGKQSAKSEFNIEDYSDELYALGRLAFEALMDNCLYFPRSELPSYDLIERLIEVGLFQVLNMSSLNPEKGVYFIHKSLQEYLGASFLKEELISKKNESTNSLSKLDSVEKILKMNEVLKFASELSEEAAREIVIHLIKMAVNEEGLTKYTFHSEAPSKEDFSEDQRKFLTLCTQLFFYCSAETKRNLFPTFLSSFRGVLLIEADQLNDLVKEKLVKTTVNVNYVFFPYNKEYSEQDYRNLTILSEQLNAVIVSCSGEKKASEFLSNLTWCPVGEFFLKKEENNAHLYFTQISTGGSGFLADDIIKALISKQETTEKTNMNSDESSEESSSSCCSKRHGLSRVQRIKAWKVSRSEVEQLIEMMPFTTAPYWIWVWGKRGEVFDAEVTESLLRSIPITHKLEELTLHRINVTPSPAVEFIDSLFKKATNLKVLDMSYNPLLGAGVDSLIKHLSRAPHLETLELHRVKMTPQQVKGLSSAIKQHGNITVLDSSYHTENGEPLPEDKWPSEDYWKKRYPELFPDSSSELEDEQEQILEETHPSVHGSPFLAHDPDTVGTFPVPPDPAAGVVLAEAPTPAEHGSSHGQTSFSGYLPPHVDPQHHSFPDIHTHYPNTPSTIFTPGGSWRYPYPSGSGLSTVTQGESHLECLSVNEDSQGNPKSEHEWQSEPDLIPDSSSESEMEQQQHYSSPVIQSHHHSTPSSIFIFGIS
ncbi:unnamed protein product, partial [Porites evermanni]